MRIAYQTIEFDEVDIHVRTLRDHLQFEDKDGVAEKMGISSATWPLFGVIWPSGQVLAHLMADHNVAGKRILEVGCGIGLASLILNSRMADVTSTDYHPEAEHFLAENTKLNKDRDIPFVRTGWDEKISDLGIYDLIIGSDILYESEHAKILSEFIDQHARSRCEVIIVDPGRGQHARFSKMMTEFGFSHNQKPPEKTSYLVRPFKGQVLTYLR